MDLTHRSPEVVSCARCIMTSEDAPGLAVDREGVCTFCRGFERVFADIPRTEEESRTLLDPVIVEIKGAGRGHRYDCLIGVSGGVDSSYLALLLKRHGIRPLAVHFDNGWNTELSVENINRLVTTIGIDLQTYVIDWDDFRELQLAYLRASVIDIEVLTDHAIYGALFDIAIRQGIRHIVSGVNVATEYFLPEHWIYDKLDDANIKDIYRKFGSGKRLRDYPFVDARKRRRIQSSGIKVVELLNLIPYDVNRARQDIEKSFGWRPYDGKHHESIFTRFYQGYILPRKFKVDKRKAHLSNLICSGQMTRQQALAEYERGAYTSAQAAEDLDYVCKKLHLSRSEFEDLMRLPPRRHNEFENYRMLVARFPVLRPVYPLWRAFRKRWPV